MGSTFTTPSQEICILTINVWSGLTYKGFFKMGQFQDDPERRYELLVSEKKKYAPDIIAIQEANPLPHYTERLSIDLGYQSIYRFSKLSIISWGSEKRCSLFKKDKLFVRHPFKATIA